jgi:hypothetical protein
MSFAYALIGPSIHIFHLPEKNFVLMSIGLFLIGSCAPLAFIPCLPEIID